MPSVFFDLTPPVINHNTASIRKLHAGNDSGKVRNQHDMMNVPGFQDSLWTNGPSPGSFYNFPGNQNKSKTAEDFSPIKRTQ